MTMVDGDLHRRHGTLGPASWAPARCTLCDVGVFCSAVVGIGLAVRGVPLVKLSFRGPVGVSERRRVDVLLSAARRLLLRAPPGRRAGPR